ncbi:MAG: hypothetical protein AAB908_00710 [Patescibacteria group bacterium]
MAEEEKGSALDAALDSIAETVHGLLQPKEESIFPWWLNLHKVVHVLGEWYVSRALLLITLYISLVFVAETTFPDIFLLAGSWILFALPVVGVVAGYKGFEGAWLWYAQSYYIYTRTNPVLLEVKMPAEILKSPRAMEQVLTSFWIRAGTTTFIDRGYYGGVRPYASLEIASLGGSLHFFIWCRKQYQNILEAAMYSQYPEVEIVEVEDYASKFQYDPHKHHCFVTDYVYDNIHQKGGVTDVYPIKTYHEFEIDEEEPEEHTVDPYSSVLEVLSAMNSEEQAWVQIIIRGYMGKEWQKEMHHEVERIREEASQQIAVDPETGKEVTKLSFPRPTELQKEQMHAIERHMGKLPFDVCLRGIYIAPAGKMRSAEYTAFRWIWRPFNNPNYLNALRPRRAHNDFDYLYQDWGQGPNGVRWQLATRRYFDAYRRRQGFHPPWTWPDLHMSAETIATLWHPPSVVVKPPGLEKIHVGKAEAPHNLPM